MQLSYLISPIRQVQLMKDAIAMVSDPSSHKDEMAWLNDPARSAEQVRMAMDSVFNLRRPVYPADWKRIISRIA